MTFDNLDEIEQKDVIMRFFKDLGKHDRAGRFLSIDGCDRYWFYKKSALYEHGCKYELTIDGSDNPILHVLKEKYLFANARCLRCIPSQVMTEKQIIDLSSVWCQFLKEYGLDTGYKINNAVSTL